MCWICYEEESSVRDCRCGEKQVLRTVTDVNNPILGRSFGNVATTKTNLTRVATILIGLIQEMILLMQKIRRLRS
jgi:hypothetical protein